MRRSRSPRARGGPPSRKIALSRCPRCPQRGIGGWIRRKDRSAHCARRASIQRAGRPLSQCRHAPESRRRRAAARMSRPRGGGTRERGRRDRRRRMPSWCGASTSLRLARQGEVGAPAHRSRGRPRPRTRQDRAPRRAPRRTGSRRTPSRRRRRRRDRLSRARKPRSHASSRVRVARPNGGHGSRSVSSRRALHRMTAIGLARRRRTRPPATTRDRPQWPRPAAKSRSWRDMRSSGRHTPQWTSTCRSNRR